MKVVRGRESGATTIEFALGGMVLFLSTFAILEVSHRIFVANLVEYALREVVRDTQVFEGTNSHESYNTKLDSLLNDNDKLWSHLVTENNFSLSEKYFYTFNDFVNDVGVESSAGNIPDGYVFAQVTLSYDYAPILDLGVNPAAEISRTTVLTLEHEGWEE